MLGERFAKARRNAGFTQKDLAEKLSVSIETISKYERDMVNPKDDKKVEIAKVLNVSLDYLLGAVDMEMPLIREDSIYLPKGFPIEAISEAQEQLKVIVLKHKYKTEL